MAADDPRTQLAAIVTRGQGIEAWHDASIAVIDAQGALSHAYGDPELSTLARSVIKPFQALPLVSSGAYAALGLALPELAIATASHNGSDAHLSVVTSLLAKAGATTADLRCGAHLPIEYRLQNRPATKSEDEDPLRHNCSGKHAGFLAVARHLGQPLETYLAPDGDVQKAVRAAVAEASQTPEHTLVAGIDGCSAPNYGIALSALARAMLRLIAADASHSDFDEALARVKSAMLAHPLLVSGLGRFDYDLMQAFPNNAISKSGAEGIQVVAFHEPKLAAAIKVHDGAARAVAPVCLSMLEQLGVSLPESLARYRTPSITNYRGIVTGQIRPVFTLQGP